LVTMSLVGIVQGRMTPSGGILQKFPDGQWQEELALAKDLGFDYIEWLADSVYNKENPVWSGKGLDDVVQKMKENALVPYSICIDHIMARPLTSVNKPEAKSSYQDLVSIIKHAYWFGIRVVVLPFLEGASVHNNEKGIIVLGDILKKLDQEIGRRNITFCAETDLSQNEHSFLFSNLPDNFGICYDTGNRTFFGFVPEEEIPFLAKWIRHVHIKDKAPDGKNIMLGTGLVDFDKAFKALFTINYSGALTLETSRGDNEKRAARANLAFLHSHLKHTFRG